MFKLNVIIVISTIVMFVIVIIITLNYNLEADAPAGRGSGGAGPLEQINTYASGDCRHSRILSEIPLRKSVCMVTPPFGTRGLAGLGSEQ